MRTIESSLDWRRTAALAAGLLLSFTLAACDEADEPEAVTSETLAAPPTETASPEPDAEGPEESFRAWLAASREPDAETACGYLTPELVERMVAEMTADGWPGITDCESMTVATAELHAAFDQPSEVDIEVVSHTDDRAELFVTYAGGDCGTVVLRPEGARWVITEQSQEAC